MFRGHSGEFDFFYYLNQTKKSKYIKKKLYVCFRQMLKSTPYKSWKKLFLMFDMHVSKLIK